MDAPCICRPLALVADDEPQVRYFLTICLESQGFVALAATCGEEAVELLQTRQDEVALALIDQRMPGMDGLATVAALRALRPGLPCCLMGGNLIGEPDIGAAGTGVVLEKPFSMAQLADTLERLLAGNG